MKKVFLSAITLLFSVIMFAGCVNIGGETGDNTGGGNGGGTGGGTTTSVLKNFSEFFNTTVTARYNDQVTQVLDHTGQYESFTDLLDRQIEVLAQDILFRLFITYGKQDNGQWLPINYTNYNQPSYVITENIIGNGNYNLNGNYALIDTHSIISIPDSYDSNSPVYLLANGSSAKYEIDRATYFLNDPATYAFLLYDNYPSNLFRNKFYLQDSISGSYRTSNNQVDYDYNTAWNWDYSSANISTSDSASVAFNKFINTYKSTFKTAIANLLATNNHTGLNYSTALNRINHLGFNVQNKNSITNYILNEIIGEYNVNADTNTYKPYGAYEVLSPSNDTTYPEIFKKYKAYEIVVSSIANTAFNNTFYNTNTSLYVERANKLDEKQSNIMYTSLSDKNYISVQFRPSKQINLTKLEITVNGVEKTSLNAVKYSVYSSTTSSVATDRSVSLGNSMSTATTHKITLDFSTLTTRTINSNGYIIVNFNVDTSKIFSLTINGYYS